MFNWPVGCVLCLLWLFSAVTPAHVAALVKAPLDKQCASDANLAFQKSVHVSAVPVQFV